MKKYFLSLIALALLLGAALADEVDVGADEASVTQRINLTIPQRVALHLLVPKGYSGSLEDAVNDALAGELEPMDTYPAIKDLDGDGSISDEEKGTLICLNQKVLQKFCNNREGCELDLKVTRTLGNSTYGKLGVLDEAPYIGHSRFVAITPGVNDDGDPLELLKVLGERLPGWLDDLITEAFWFDGSEVAGTYEFNFLFQLAAL
jgi:hypothetical protein